jgi:hypothetical protein
MKNKIEWKNDEFDRKVLAKLVNEIDSTDEAIEKLASAWGTFIVDVVFKNTAPDGDYVNDVMLALSEIQLLQIKLHGDQPGPLSNFSEVRHRFDRNRIVVPMPRYSASLKSTETE